MNKVYLIDDKATDGLSEDLKNKLDNATTLIQQMLEQDGKLLPCAYVYSGKELHIIVGEFHGKTEEEVELTKLNFNNSVIYVAAKIKADTVIFATECWISVKPSLKDISMAEYAKGSSNDFVLPRDDPNKRDVVVITIETLNNKYSFVGDIITTSDNKKTIEKFELPLTKAVGVDSFDHGIINNDKPQFLVYKLFSGPELEEFVSTMDQIADSMLVVKDLNDFKNTTPNKT